MIIPNAPFLTCYNLDEMNAHLADNVQKLLIFHVNIRSLNKHIDELRLVINSMPKTPDIIVCTETYNIISSTFYHIDNYDMYFANSDINGNDGVCIYIRSGITHTNKVVNIGRVKALYTKIKTKTGDIFLTSLYRSHDILIPNFMDHLLMHIVDNTNVSNHFIVGDININILIENKNVSNYLNNYYHFGYRPFINVPTRVTENSQTCIDHIFGKISENTTIIPLVCDLDIADHYATMILVEKTVEQEIDNKNYIDKINYNKLNNLLYNINWNTFYDIEEIDQAVKFIVDTLEHTISLSTERINIKKQKNVYKPRKPWMSVGLLTSCKTKYKLYYSYKNNPNDLHRKLKYNRYKNSLLSLLRQAKERYYNDLVSNIAHDNKKLWRFINKNIDKKKVKSPSHKYILVFEMTLQKIKRKSRISSMISL